MSKEPKKQKLSRKEEEAQVLAQMNAALLEKGVKTEQKPMTKAEKRREKRNSGYDDTMPEKIHCPRCKTLMEKGKCHNCGYYVYVPMNEKTRNKIRLILGGILIAGMVIAFMIYKITGG